MNPLPPQPPVNGDFVTEGFFLALPAAFPGVSLPLERGESRLQRLAATSSGDLVFASTAGPRPHLVQWAPRGTYGYAVDLGVPEGAQEIDALTCTPIPGRKAEGLAVATWHGTHSQVALWPTAGIGHGIQEWHVFRPAPRPLCSFPGQRITDIAVDPRSGCLLLLAPRRLSWISLKNGSSGGFDLPEVHPLFLKIDPTACHVWTRDDRLLRLDPAAAAPVEEARCRPPEPCGPPVLVTAVPGAVLAVDAEGQVVEWSAGAWRGRFRGRIPLAPVHGLCRLPDGRIFASAGEGIAHFYVLEGRGGWARDLGVPVSTLSARRYGLQFGPLLVGRGGEIYLPENDDGGHLWMYFPELRPEVPPKGLGLSKRTAGLIARANFPAPLLMGIGGVPAWSVLCAVVLGIIGTLDERFWRDLFPLSLLALPVVVLAKAAGLLVSLAGVVWGLVAFLRPRPGRGSRLAAAVLALVSLLTAVAFALWLSTQPAGMERESAGRHEDDSSTRY